MPDNIITFRQSNPAPGELAGESLPPPSPADIYQTLKDEFKTKPSVERYVAVSEFLRSLELETLVPLFAGWAFPRFVGG